MIIVAEFKCADRKFGSYELSSVPSTGEIVNIDDECFLVRDRKWNLNRPARYKHGSVHVVVSLIPWSTERA